MKAYLKTCILFLFVFGTLKINAQINDSIHPLIQKTGQLITCKTDSSSLLLSDTIRIFYSTTETQKLELNLFCPNFPKGDTLRKNYMWPASIEFAEEKYFIYKYNRKQEINDKGALSVIYDASKFYFGEYKLDEKSKTLELSIKQINWSKKYNYTFFKKGRVLTLVKA